MTDLEKLLKEVNYTLHNISNKPFSPEAFVRFKEHAGIYIGTLFNEAQKTATRNKADNISSSHVDSASQYLIKKQSSKLNRLWGILGGVFLGATLSNILALTILNQQFSTIGLVATIFLGAIGSFLIGINVLQE